MILLTSDQHKATSAPHYKGEAIWWLPLLHQEVPVDGGAAPTGQRHQPQQGQQESDILLLPVVVYNLCIIVCVYIYIFWIVCWLRYPVPCSSRTAQSLTWCLTMLWTSGWPALQQKNVSLSRSCTTPARPTGRGKQGVWERLGSWGRWASRGEWVSALSTKSELVPVIWHQAQNPEPCRPDGRATFLPDRQSSSTASPNSREVVSHD